MRTDVISEVLGKLYGIPFRVASESGHETLSDVAGYMSQYAQDHRCYPEELVVNLKLLLAMPLEFQMGTWDAREKAKHDCGCGATKYGTCEYCGGRGT